MKGAGEVIPLIENEEKITTHLTLSESTTLVGNLFSKKTGLKLFNYILDNYEVGCVDKYLIFDAMDISLEYDGTLSFADSVSVKLMKDLKLEKIVSFDSGFDKVEGITRIH